MPNLKMKDVSEQNVIDLLFSETDPASTLTGLLSRMIPDDSMFIDAISTSFQVMYQNRIDCETKLKAEFADLYPKYVTDKVKKDFPKVDIKVIKTIAAKLKTVRDETISAYLFNQKVGKALRECSRNLKSEKGKLFFTEHTYPTLIKMWEGYKTSIETLFKDIGIDKSVLTYGVSFMGLSVTPNSVMADFEDLVHHFKAGQFYVKEGSNLEIKQQRVFAWSTKEKTFYIRN